MNKFVIKHRNLKEGTFNYKFDIDDSFFKIYPESEIQKGKIQVNTELSVTKNLLTFNISLNGTVKLQCDRCLDDFDFKIKYDTILYVDFGNQNSDLSDADNRITISNLSEEIVLDKHFYDYLHLSLPYKRIHSNNENGNPACNVEMLKKIKKYTSEKKEEIIDPRWEKLKSLYN